MRTSVSGRFRAFIKEEFGQTALVVALTASTMLALAGTSVEVGHIYYAYNLLVASTNAATLAGAQVMPDTNAATTNINMYSSATYTGGSGSKVAGYNASTFLQNATVTPSYLCLNTVRTTLGIDCLTASGGSGGYNALQVRQTAQVNLWFGGLVGVRKMTLAAVSTAAIKGGTNTPWNIAILLDATGSMGNPDNGTQCTGTQESCALQGVRYLLSDLYPCQMGQTCATGGSYVDSVSLFVFPPILTSTAGKDYCTGSGAPTNEYYEVPTLPSGTSGWTYQLPFGSNAWSNDYRVNDNSTTGLNTGSNAVQAAGGKSGCSGVQAAGRGSAEERTYYAQAIYMAQAALIQQQTTAKNNSQNALIILSDGDATACASGANTTGGACSTSSDMLSSSSAMLNGTGTKKTNPSGYTSYTYPSALGECGQAVLAAQAAANAGTQVYTIGYGSPTSGCSSDKTYSAAVTTGGGVWGPGKSPCQALAAMASSPGNFYSDDGNGCQATTPDNAAITSLTAIFTKITRGFTNARLIPNGTT